MPGTRAYRFLIADDHPLFRDALRQTIAGQHPEAVVGEAGSFEGVIERLAADDDVDLVLLDLAMPGMHGLAGLLFLRTQYPGVPVVVVSASEDVGHHPAGVSFRGVRLYPEVAGDGNDRPGDRRGARGGRMDAASTSNSPRGGDLDAAAARIRTLTPQQMRVLMMLSEGLLNKQIAHELDVSEATVKAHVSAILRSSASTAAPRR